MRGSNDPRARPISPQDWAKTTARGDGGYDGGLFLDVRGREPQGTIAPGDYERVRGELEEKIAAITDPSGRNIGSRVRRPEDLYRKVRGVAPDLVVYFGDLGWRSVGTVGFKEIHTFDNDTGSDEANHDWNGIFVMKGNGRRPGGRTESLQIYDVGASMLEVFGVDVDWSTVSRTGYPTRQP